MKTLAVKYGNKSVITFREDKEGELHVNMHFPENNGFCEYDVKDPFLTKEVKKAVNTGEPFIYSCVDKSNVKSIQRAEDDIIDRVATAYHVSTSEAADIFLEHSRYSSRYDLIWIEDNHYGNLCQQTIPGSSCGCG